MILASSTDFVPHLINKPPSHTFQHTHLKQWKEVLECGVTGKMKEYELHRRNFSEMGNFGFGIQEPVNLGARYDPAIGVFGMDFYAMIGRASLGDKEEDQEGVDRHKAPDNEGHDGKV
jgi:ribosomal protein L5